MRTPTLEAHTEFSGVGAHELNPRFDPIPGEHETEMVVLSPESMPALFHAQAYAVLAATGEPLPRFDGPDVSHYQYSGGAINWQLVRQSPAFWGATKITQSTSYVDSTAQQSRDGMRACGFRNRGLYHWLSPATDPMQQAAWMIQHVESLETGEFIMLDVEESGVDVAKTLACAEALEQHYGRPTVVYTGAYVAGGTLWQNTSIRHSAFGPRPMILAAYTSLANAKTIAHYDSYPWDARQYSSNGPVAGIVGRCDMNQVDNRAVFDAACGIVNAAPAPAPAPMPLLAQEEDIMPKFVILNSASMGGALVQYAQDGTYTMHGVDSPEDAQGLADAYNVKVGNVSDSLYQWFLSNQKHS